MFDSLYDILSLVFDAKAKLRHVAMIFAALAAAGLVFIIYVLGVTN